MLILCILTLLLYAAGWAYCEVSEYQSDVRKYGRSGRRKYLYDPFNLLDLSMIAMLLLLVLTRATMALLSWPEPAAWLAAAAGHEGGRADSTQWAHSVAGALVSAEVPCQALLALVSSLRIMELLFLFPQTGPLLLMAIRMLQDLMQFLVLFTFVVVSFGCAFYVLLKADNARVPPSASLYRSGGGGGGGGGNGGGGGGGVEALGDANPSGGVAAAAAAVRRLAVSGDDTDDAVQGDPLTVITVVRLLVQGTLNGESDFVLETMRAGSPIAWGLMFLFGVVVVLLLLNLLIARFAKTFDMVYENVEHNFKVPRIRCPLCLPLPA